MKPDKAEGKRVRRQQTSAAVASEFPAWTGDSRVPKEVDVVIVGGGIVGVCTALAFWRKGVSVAVCEKGEIAGEQSSRNWGWCRTARRDLRELPLSLESLRLWSNLDAELGISTGFQKSGILYIAKDSRQMAAHDEWLGRAKALCGSDALSSALLSPRAVAAHLPELSLKTGIPIYGGLFTPTDGGAEPQRAVPQIAAALHRRGVPILTNCAVRGIETSGGAVSAVVTEAGVIRCSSIVIAGGAWSRLLCSRTGIDLPQLVVRSSVLSTTRMGDGPKLSGCHGSVGFRRRDDGSYVVASSTRSLVELTPDSFKLFKIFWPLFRTQRGSVRITLRRSFVDALRQSNNWSLDEQTIFERIRTRSPASVRSCVDAALRDFVALFPQLDGIEIDRSWSGDIDVTPDAIPVISTVDNFPGLVISTGFSGHGFGIGPGAGKLTADLVTHDVPIADPWPFRLSRFSDGSQLELDGGF